MSRLNLGEPEAGTPARAAECPWKLAAILLVAAVVILLGFWLPGPLYKLVQQSARIIGGES
jgi:hypothetical protein